MAKELPPYLNSTGQLQDLLKKIQEAPPPARFSHDFLFTNLKFTKSGSTLPFIPFLKRIGFISNDGTPSDIYKKFRNPDKKISGNAMAQAIKVAYSNLYSRNEYFHNLNKTDLKNFLIEVLELEANSVTLNALIRTIDTLKLYANFDITSAIETKTLENGISKGEHDTDDTDEHKEKRKVSELNGINLSYTINLNLPETSDIKVFDAIFKSLKENLLKK
ncbi:MAG: DUF5343 domain-containing protein [Bacteroidetes bacterium]|nr:DUF5343 domain-containing protein [Bacteroidota bacterium]